MQVPQNVYSVTFKGQDGQTRHGSIKLYFVDRPDEEQNDAFQKLEGELEQFILRYGLALLESCDMPSGSTIPVSILGNKELYTFEDVLVGINPASKIYQDLREGWAMYMARQEDTFIDHSARFLIATGHLVCPACEGTDSTCPIDQRMKYLHAIGYRSSFRWYFLDITSRLVNISFSILIFGISLFVGNPNCMYATMRSDHDPVTCPECRAKAFRNRVFGREDNVDEAP